MRRFPEAVQSIHSPGAAAKFERVCPGLAGGVVRRATPVTPLQLLIINGLRKLPRLHPVTFCYIQLTALHQIGQERAITGHDELTCITVGVIPLKIMKTNKLPPIHPGEILREEFMKPRGLSQNALARALNVPPRRINEIVLEKRGITADTALRLARFFGTSAEMWTGLQADYELRRVRYEKARTIEREVEPLAALQPAIA